MSSIRTVLSQYADINLRSGVFFFILKCTTEPSCPVTFKLMCSSVYNSTMYHTYYASNDMHGLLLTQSRVIRVLFQTV